VKAKAAEREKELEAEKRAMVKATIEANEQTIASAKDRVEHVDPDALVKRGQLVQPPAGVTNLDLKTKYAYMSDRQKKGWSDLMQARSALDTLNTLNDQVIVAETPREAAKQGLNLWVGGLSRWNPTATSVLATSEAVTSGLSKSVGPESGVLTAADVKRWQSAVTASFFDTKDVKDIKKAIMEDFYGAVHRAAVSEIVGAPSKVDLRSELKKTLSRMENASKVVVIRNPKTKEVFSGPKGTKIPAGWEVVTGEDK
jgi:cell division FtsZ-interacting protein ZapD